MELDVNVPYWDGNKQLPHPFSEQHPFNSSRISPQFESSSNKQGHGYPSVTTLISCIGPKEPLYFWQNNQIKLLGFPEFQKQGRLRMTTSNILHSLMKSLLEEFRQNGKMLRTEAQILEENEEKIPHGYLPSVLPIISDFINDLKEVDRELIVCEKMIFNHGLVYKGKFDAVFPINGELTLVDWKSVGVGSSKSREEPGEATLQMDNKMQLVAYIGAINSDQAFSHLPPIKQAAIVNVFQSSRTAELVLMEEEEIKHTFEQYKGWVNAFWWTMANAKPLLGEIIDFCYIPPPSAKKAARRMDDFV